MQIVVLSGKGGTGKTFVSTNLFNVAKNATYIDCDIEEPNGHIYFDQSEQEIEVVNKYVPSINQDTCIGCKKCVDFCKFHSLMYLMDRVLFFDEQCHSCGGCMYVCPTKSIQEEPKRIGEIQHMVSNGKDLYTGLLDIGEASGVRIIDALLRKAKKEELSIVDCPPGSDCSVMEAIKDADYAIVVVEPTIFGEHNMKMILELLSIYHKPFGVVFNKSMEEDYESILTYVKEMNGSILGSIPFNKKIGEINNNGLLVSNEMEEMNTFFKELLKKVTS